MQDERRREKEGGVYLCLVLFTECLVLRAGGSGLGQLSLHTGDLIERRREGEGEGE